MGGGGDLKIPWEKSIRTNKRKLFSIMACLETGVRPTTISRTILSGLRARLHLEDLCCEGQGEGIKLLGL